LETSILDEKVEDMDFKTKLEVYEKISKLHITYIETVRKVLAQIDLSRYLKAAGILDLFKKFERMTPQSLAKLTKMIEGDMGGGE